MQGDSFLKYFSSVYVFVLNPALSEGALHKARQHLISNKMLKQCGLTIGLPSYIQGKTFSYKLWQPPNFTVQGVQHSGRSNDVALSGGDMEINTSESEKQTLVDDPVIQLAPLSQSTRRSNTHDDSITQWLGDKVKRVFYETELSDSSCRLSLMSRRLSLEQLIFPVVVTLRSAPSRPSSYLSQTSNNGMISAGKLLLRRQMSQQGSVMALFRRWKRLLELNSSTRIFCLKLWYASFLFDHRIR